MEILGFHVQAENVGEELPQRGGDLSYAVRAQVRRDFNFRTASNAYSAIHVFRLPFFFGNESDNLTIRSKESHATSAD
jgi:hypothetical protein